MRGRAVGLVVLAAMLWGTTGTAQVLGGATGSPLSVGAVRMAIGAAGLAVVARRGMWSVPRGPWLVAAASMAGYQVAFFSGVARTGVAVGTVVAIGSAPVLAGLLAWPFLRERPEPRWWAATAMAVTGVALISGRPGSVDSLGLLLVVLAGLAYAVYALATKRLLEKSGSRSAMAAVFAGAAILLAPLLVSADLSWIATPAGLGAAVWLGLAATAGAYLAFAAGLRYLTVGHATTVSVVEPATAMLLGVALLGERPPTLAWFGVLLVIAAVAVLARPQRRRLAPAGR